MTNVRTTKIGKGVDYAKVADRLKEFREKNPRSKIQTEVFREEKRVVAKAWVWKDKTALLELLKAQVTGEDAKLSADSTGTAETIKTDDKALEKLETVAVGRALALLGYAMSGEIASSEEMEEFEDYKLQKHQDAIMEACAALEQCSSIPALRKTFVGLLLDIRGEKVVVEKKEDMKKKLSEAQGEEKNHEE